MALMDMKDWISGAVGTLILLLGALPLISTFGVGPEWFAFNFPVALLSWVVAVGGFYLIINSVIEITNSNIVGWISFGTAAVFTTIGVLKVLGQFGKVSGFFAMDFVSGIIFNVIFIILGCFLMVATFAMEM
ncbi:MAG: hypothetical protein O2779_02520 [Nanoarchaeota archaeon]|nr:hypothetical protein [Nanoarchaeota archaeon]